MILLIHPFGEDATPQIAHLGGCLAI